MPKKKKINLKFHFFKKSKKLSKVPMMLCNQSIQKLINMKIYQLQKRRLMKKKRKRKF